LPLIFIPVCIITLAGKKGNHSLKRTRFLGFFPTKAKEAGRFLRFYEQISLSFERGFVTMVVDKDRIGFSLFFMEASFGHII
jgi:hypothetical protein